MGLVTEARCPFGAEEGLKAPWAPGKREKEGESEFVLVKREVIEGRFRCCRPYRVGGGCWLCLGEWGSAIFAVLEVEQRRRTPHSPVGRSLCW